MSDTHVLATEEVGRYERYQKLTAQGEAAWAGRVQSESDYWKAWITIDDERLWEMAFNSQAEWLGDLAAQAYGPSRSNFFRTRSAVDRLRSAQVDDTRIWLLIGHAETAVRDDMAGLFVKTGRRTYELAPGVAEKLSANGTNIQEAIEDLLDLSPGKARQSVNDLRGGRRIWPLHSDWLDRRTLLVRLAETGGDLDTMYYDIQVSVLEQDPPPLVGEYLERQFNPNRS